MRIPTICALLLLPLTAVAADQHSLAMEVNAGERFLDFDWPAIHVGTAEYPAGPTGVTVIRFPGRATVAVDVRGGGPSSVNSDYIRLGYSDPELDAIVFAGGSWYGLEAVTGVSSALKDDGIRDGNAFGIPPNIALATGSIIFDFAPRRLNEIYPDRELAQRAFRAAVPGRMALGARGAGRFTKTGSYFGCSAYSGQGAAFRQIGALKIAVFTVVNAYGAVVDREGRVPNCYRAEGWPADLRINDLTKQVSERRGAKQQVNEMRSRNTTLSLVVVNQRLTMPSLQRLAIQVHTSMGRAIQPFATYYDGDVLYTASTQEWSPPENVDDVVDAGVIAADLMWDAILDAAPLQPVAPAPLSTPVHTARELKALAGDYSFSRFATLRVTVDGAKLFARAVGERAIYAIGHDASVEALPVSRTDFMVPGRYPLVLRFARPGQIVVNPGHWQQAGERR